MCGKDGRSLSKEEGNAAIQIQSHRLETNQWGVTMVQTGRDSKVTTWNPRKPPNRRSCFLFRIKSYEKLSALRRGDAFKGGNALVQELELPYAFPQPSVLNDALDPPDHSKNAYSRDVLKGILISLAAVFVKDSARLVACSAKACI